MYRPTLALDAIGRDDPTSLSIAKVQMQALLDCLTTCSGAYIPHYPNLPDVLRSGVRYDDDRPPKGSVCGDDDWCDLMIVLRRKRGDCDDLAAARAAQLRARGINARAIPLLRRSPGKHDYHAVVMWPKGLKSYPPTVYPDPSGSGILLEDPSRILGMR
jgi:hypothetical protein